MDTRTATNDVSAMVQDIKTFMPDTYKSIQDKAAKVGNDAFAMVRRGLRGEANCFWAMEAGRVVGTPFTLVEVQRDIAQYLVTFGCAHVCVFGLTAKEAADGTH